MSTNRNRLVISGKIVAPMILMLLGIHSIVVPFGHTSVRPEFVRDPINDKRGARMSDESCEVESLVKEFIDEAFKTRDLVGAFEKHSAFELWDEQDTKANDNEIFALPLTEDLPKGIDSETRARIAAVIWKNNFQYVFLDLGRNAVEDSNASMRNKAEYDELRNRVLENYSSSLNVFDFEGMSELAIKRSLDEKEKVFEEIETLLFEHVDKDIYKTNIAKLLNSVKVRSISAGGRIYYQVGVQNQPSTGFLVSRKKGALKIIGLLDSR